MQSQHNNRSILYYLVCYCSQLLKVCPYTRTSKIICSGLTMYYEIATCKFIAFKMKSAFVKTLAWQTQELGSPNFKDAESFPSSRKTWLMIYWSQHLWCQIITKNNWMKWVQTWTKVTFIKTFAYLLRLHWNKRTLCRGHMSTKRFLYTTFHSG